MSLVRAFGGSENSDNLTGTQEWALNRLGGQLLSNIGRGVDAYSGQITPGTNPNLQQGFLSAQGQLSQNPNLAPAIQQALSGAGDPEGVRSMYEAALGPARNEFNDQLRELGNRYGDVHGRSGALPRMAALAASRYGDNLNNTLAQLTYADRQAGMNRQVQAIPGAIAADSQRASSLGQLLGIGDLERTYEGQNRAEDYEKWAYEQPYNNPWLSLIGPVLGTQAHGTQQQKGIVGGTLGGIGSLAGGFA